MEFIFDALKHLATTLALADFLLVMGAVLMTAFVVARVAVKYSGHDGIIGKLLGSPDDAPAPESKQLSDLNHKMDLVLTQYQLNESLRPVHEVLGAIRNELRSDDVVMLAQANDLSVLKHDLEKFNDKLVKELDEIKHSLKMNDQAGHTNSESIKALVGRGQDIIVRVGHQIERIEEFTKNAIPEFRAYHKDLAKEVSELGRDIALVERSVQTQINNPHVVKLR